MPVTADVEANCEIATIAYINDIAKHGQDIAIPVRRFEQAKFDPDTGELDPLILPSVIVKATSERQLHPRLQVFLLTVEIVLEAIAHDTTDAQWKLWSGALFTMLMVPDLAGDITGETQDFSTTGIPERIPGGKVIEGSRWRQTFRLSVWGCVPTT